MKGLAPGNPPTDKFQKIFCCFNIYFNSFNSLICFRGSIAWKIQRLTLSHEGNSKRNEDNSKRNEDKSKRNEDKNNLVMRSKIIYNRYNDDTLKEFEYFLSDKVCYKRGVGSTPKNFSI